MEAAVSKELRKTCKELRVIADEAQEAIWQLAPRDWVGKRKAAIAGVSRALGWTFARTWNIAHRRARRIDAHEMDRLRNELNKVNALRERGDANRERINELIYARHEIARAGQAHREGNAGAGLGGSAVGEGEQAGGGIGPRIATTPAAR
jgi:hypothetical protein